jgi:hypothetical protein
MTRVSDGATRRPDDTSMATGEERERETLLRVHLMVMTDQD